MKEWPGYVTLTIADQHTTCYRKTKATTTCPDCAEAFEPMYCNPWTNGGTSCHSCLIDHATANGWVESRHVEADDLAEVIALATGEDQ